MTCDFNASLFFTLRVYTLGIGEGVSTSLIKGIANNGGGIAEFSQGSDDIKSKVI